MQLEAKVKEHELMETMLRNQVKELEVARASDQQEKLAMQRSLSESMTKASAPVDEATVLLGTMQEQVRSGVERDHTLEDKVRRLQNDLIEAKESAVDMELENEGLKQRVTSLEQGQLKLEEEQMETLEDKIRQLGNELIDAKEAAVDLEEENKELQRRVIEYESGGGPSLEDVQELTRKLADAEAKISQLEGKGKASGGFTTTSSSILRPLAPSAAAAAAPYGSYAARKLGASPTTSTATTASTTPYRTSSYGISSAPYPYVSSAYGSSSYDYYSSLAGQSVSSAVYPMYSVQAATACGTYGYPYAYGYAAAADYTSTLGYTSGAAYPSVVATGRYLSI